MEKQEKKFSEANIRLYYNDPGKNKYISIDPEFAQNLRVGETIEFCSTSENFVKDYWWFLNPTKLLMSLIYEITAIEIIKKKYLGNKIFFDARVHHSISKK